MEGFGFRVLLGSGLPYFNAVLGGPVPEMNQYERKAYTFCSLVASTPSCTWTFEIAVARVVGFCVRRGGEGRLGVQGVGEF